MNRAGRLLAMASLLLLAAGCRTETAPHQPIHLRAMPAEAQADLGPMYTVRLVRLQHRQRPDAPVEDLWRLLGTTTLPHEKLALWEANDLRLGDGAQLAADRLNALIQDTPDRTARTSVLQVRENYDFVLALGGERDRLDLLWTDPQGRLVGRHFERALAVLRLVCRTDPGNPGAVRLAIVPEVQYGAEETRWVPTEAGFAQRSVRPATTVTDLSAEVVLAPGRLLVIGGRRSSDVSLGGALFYERRGPDLWSETLVVTAERLVPGKMPEGQTVPFLRKPEPRGAPAPRPSAPRP